MDTWLGPFTVVVDAEGAVLASGWTGDVADLLPQVHPTLRGEEPVPRKDLGEVTAAIRAYHDGEVGAITDVPVRQHSNGSFLLAAWKALREVEPGRPISYRELASRVGSPAAVRAAGQACARNAAALFVPCHRVVPTAGSVGGFRWGPEIKRRLLVHESTAFNRGGA
jgi:methylated-DNA-[protein]-cysteine S-methyltransferase